MKNENLQISFVIKRVQEVFFYLNEKLFVPDPEKIIQIQLGETIGFNFENKYVNFTLRIFLHYANSPINDTLADIRVENIFEVPQLNSFLNKDNLVILPQDLIISIVSMSISHARALLCKNLAGTSYQSVILPISNARDISEHFYPYFFNREATVQLRDAKGNIQNTTEVNKKKEKRTASVKHYTTKKI